MTLRKKYIPTAPRFRSVKSVVDAKLVRYLAKRQRFLRGFYGIYFSLSWLLATVVNDIERVLVMDIKVGDILQLKKQHPCGSKEWEVLRVGADFRLKCMGCGHQIMIPRRQAEKNVKNVKSASYSV